MVVGRGWRGWVLRLGQPRAGGGDGRRGARGAWLGAGGGIIGQRMTVVGRGWWWGVFIEHRRFPACSSIHRNGGEGVGLAGGWWQVVGRGWRG